MICPKCGRPVDASAVICPGCDFILDTEFLGQDILDEEHQLRPGQGGVDPAVFNLADAVILGNIGDDTSSFETSDSGFHLKKDLQAARLYVSGRSQAVMSPDAVIAVIDANDRVRLTPFEKHVLRFIDGRRPVEAIRRQAGLDEAEVKTALATLADKGVVKVVGRALADGADFDIDTAPGAGGRKPPRRVRGTLVGAVVVVGDAADQAIDDAFRTQVRAEAPVIAPPEEHDDAGVFSSSDEGLPALAANNLRGAEQGTEVPARRASSSSASTVRPAAQRAAINAARGTGRFAAPDLSADADASDGFDDFGDASNLATAVIQQPSLSEESVPPAEAGRRPATGVFAELGGDRRSNLSDLDDFDAPGVDDLADSRVEPRPVLPAALLARPAPARAAPPAVPSSVSEPETSPLNAAERAAMTGSVWDEAARGKAARVPTPPPGTNVRPRAELSTSLSDLLDEDDEFEPTAAGTQPAPAPRAPRALDPSCEPTAFRPPPTPMPPVIAGGGRRPVADPPSASTRQAAAPPAADDGFGEDSFEASTDGEAMRQSQMPTGEIRRDVRRPAPPRPDDNLPMTAAPLQESVGSDEEVGSAEVVDSALVIRPAAKAVPLAVAAQRARAAPPTPPSLPPELDDDDDDFMVDPDATMNLPARPKSAEGRRAPPPRSEPPVVAEEPAAKPRRVPTEDMRRKARNLFEQALKDHAIGRVGAARMNAKLATIYDPSNAEYQRVLEEWERPRTGTGASSASLSRPEYVVLYEQAQDLEDEGDIDGALELLQKGMRLAPNAAAFHNRIGVILAMRKREFERAAAEIEKAIALEPDNPHYRNNLGKVMARAARRRDPAIANAR